MKYEAVIGLEVHAQMLTDSKMFCGCPTRFGSGPNTQTCQICIGMPGVLPVANRKAVEFTIKTGLAMNCRISSFSRFARKNYFYPDLPKGYQVSQYELPLCEHGHVDIIVDGEKRRIGLTRIHLEEDAGKNIHEGNGNYSFVDLNRAGVPLMEIVSEPDIRSPREAAEYMKKLRTIVRYLGVCDGNMEQGSLRCDANVSIRPVGSAGLGVKVEMKNINSFRFVEKALEYEIRRQIATLEEGGKIVQETRLWDPSTGTTQSMRSKEEAHDYRYFPEPDLVPITADQKWIDEIRRSLPELPDEKRERFRSEYRLPEYDADLLTSEKSTADWCEDAVRAGANPKAVSNWMMGELMRILNDENRSIEECALKPRQLAEMIRLIENGTISGKIAKTVFEEMYRSGKDAPMIVEEKGLIQISDTGALETAIDDIIAKSPKEVERFRGGDEKLMGFFVGQVMKATKGKANPQIVNDILKKKLVG
ncbi:MAG TPA: Asp-tRNA(Asn)/Glu-tRNA(Gln) amidotransferase subunit GatB [Thermodesulfovibrionales bacterium]|jgi:aspartyl-tRNA(Asn)/glutamyl-tRNA(Gln) amidotransferase subunit B|nr:Asp-tRNA(Asn)/Glu-tRNA(Gln) amidotransferase subunit GatB [Thermodesulfovibrionales bacterium]